MDYKILIDDSAEELEKKVLKYLNNGYILAGGHQVITVGYREVTNGKHVLREISPNQWEFSQAIYKPDEPKEIIKERTEI